MERNKWKNEWMNKQMNIGMDKQKDKNYKPLCINTGGYNMEMYRSPVLQIR